MKKVKIFLLLCTCLLCITCISCAKDERETVITPDTPTSDVQDPTSDVQDPMSSEKPPLPETHTEEIDMDSIDYSYVKNETLREIREKQLIENNNEIMASCRSIFGYAVNESETCEKCGMHPNLLRNDCVPVENAKQIEVGMPLSQVYALIGNPHWGLDIFFTADCWSYYSEVDTMLYCYVLSDGQILKIAYEKDNNGNDIVEWVDFCGIKDAFFLNVIVMDSVKPG